MTTPAPDPADSAAATSQPPAATKRKPPERPPSSEPRQETARDTCESIVFAFILAFLFRTFVAEAFVIPTGSMAPTLFGRHKEANCPRCGLHLVVGASDELDPEAGVLRPGHRLKSAVCPNCRFEVTTLREALAFNGDRILVNKFPYDIDPPRRWDVFVFKFPEEPDVNYIKRLVGLPGETIRIRQGDLYLWDGQAEQLLRKEDPGKQRKLQIPVYDDAHPPTDLLARGWPERWANLQPDPGSRDGWGPAESGWTHAAEHRVFRVDAGQNGLAWLRYRHVVPHPEDWRRLDQGQPLQPRAQLIADFCGYNSITGDGQFYDAHDVRSVDLGAFWVGDLTLNCGIDIGQIEDHAELVFELCEGIYAYRCRINPRTGQARLFEINRAFQADAERPLTGEVPSVLVGPGEYTLSFANVDDRLCVWINDQLVDFGSPVLLNRHGATGLSLPQPSDLCPVGIAAQGVAAVVHGLKLERDIYYRAHHPQADSLEEELAGRLESPESWGRFYQDQAHADQQEIRVDDDGFLAMGDNSPRSRDSRMWAPGMQSVPRRHLVGRAFYIYWPHGVPFLNGGRGYAVTYHKEPQGNQGLVEDRSYPKYTVPFYPQIGRMKRIR